MDPATHQPSGDALEWRRAFRGRHGRPPQVLHIGNIANNAYLNAKILRAEGVEGDVLCYDYYDCMAAPEWEERELAHLPADPVYPDWPACAPGAWSPPAWFLQGPQVLCLLVLLIRRSGPRHLARALLHFLLEYRNRITPRLGWLCARWYGLPLRLAHSLAARTRQAFLLFLVWAANAAEATDPARVRRRVRWTLRGLLILGGLLMGAAATGLPAGLRAPVLLGLALLLVHAALFVWRWRRTLAGYDAVIGYATDGLYPLLFGDGPYIAFEHGTIRHIPFRDSAVGRACAATYRCAAHTLITNCDTIDAARRLGLPTYSFIPHPINEAPPEIEAAAALRARLLDELDADWLLFHPSRQHWTPTADPELMKGNDLLIRGFARFLKDDTATGAPPRAAPVRAAAIFVAWGEDVTASKALIQALGIEDRVRWIGVQPARAMTRYIMACDCLADQFHFGAFGAITPRALWLGRPTLLYLDEESHAWAFAEMPPVLNVRTPETIAAACARLYDDHRAARAVGEASRAWYAAHHSNARIAAALDACLQVVDPVLAETP